MKRLISLLLLLASLQAVAQDERLYLTGRGWDDTRTWDFYCTEGRRSGSWQTILNALEVVIEGAVSIVVEGECNRADVYIDCLFHGCSVFVYAV